MPSPHFEIKESIIHYIKRNDTYRRLSPGQCRLNNLRYDLNPNQDMCRDLAISTAICELEALGDIIISGNGIVSVANG